MSISSQESNGLFHTSNIRKKCWPLITTMPLLYSFFYGKRPFFTDYCLEQYRAVFKDVPPKMYHTRTIFLPWYEESRKRYISLPVLSSENLEDRSWDIASQRKQSYRDMCKEINEKSSKWEVIKPTRLPEYTNSRTVTELLFCRCN